MNPIRFARPDAERASHPWLGTGAALVAPGVVAGTVSHGLLSTVMPKPARGPAYAQPVAEADKAAMDYLGKRVPGGVRESLHRNIPGAAWRGATESELAGAGAMMRGGVGPPGPTGVMMHPGVRTSLKPGVLAHEIGHLEQPKWMMKRWINKAAPVGSAIGSTVAAFTGNEDTAKKAAAAGSLAAAPLLIKEADASIRGAGLLGKAGIKGARRFSPGVGLATYGALAASPWIAYGAKKMLGGYRKPAADTARSFDTPRSNLITMTILTRHQASRLIHLEAQLDQTLLGSRVDPRTGRVVDDDSILPSASAVAGVGAGGAGIYGGYKVHQKVVDRMGGMNIGRSATEPRATYIDAAKSVGADVGNTLSNLRKQLMAKGRKLIGKAA